MKENPRCRGYVREKFVDVNDSRRAAQIPAFHPQWSAQLIVSERPWRVSVLASKWPLSRNLAQSNYLTSVPLMTARHTRKQETWDLRNQNDDVILQTKATFSFTDVPDKDGKSLDIVR